MEDLEGKSSEKPEKMEASDEPLTAGTNGDGPSSSH